MLISVLMVAASLAGGEPDGVISTAPRTAVSLEADQTQPEAPAVLGAAEQALDPHGLTTDQQIERWVSARTPDVRPFADGEDHGGADERRIHGMVEAGVGTGGYRSYGAAVSIPLGENGALNLSVRKVENGLGYGYGGYGYDRHGLGRSYFNDGYALSGPARTEDVFGFEDRLIPLYGLRRPVTAPLSTGLE
jgi:hypothetical protein